MMRLNLNAMTFTPYKGFIKMERAGSSETLVLNYQIRRHHIPKDSNFDPQSCRNLIYQRTHKRMYSFRRRALYFNNSMSATAQGIQEIYQLNYLRREEGNHLVS